MAANNPAGWVQNAGATHTAEQMRNWEGLLSGGSRAANSIISRGGVNPSMGFSLQVTQTAGPSMAVIVKSGAALIPGTEGFRQGVYAVLNDADVTVSIAAAHATLPRVDSVIFKVEDQVYSGVNNTSSIVVVTGTAAGSPVAPTLPNNCIELYRVTVNAAVTTIVNANLTDRRPYLAGVGGIINCLNALRPAAGTVPVGTVIFEIDTNRLFITLDGGSNWIQHYPPTQKINESILSGITASVTFSSIPQTFRHLQLSMVCRGDAATQFIQVALRFNGDNGTTYDNQQVDGVGSTANAFSGENASFCNLGEMPGSTVVAGSCSTYTVNIPWYAATTFWKLLQTHMTLAGQTSPGQVAQLHNKIWANRWRSTAAINSLAIIPQTGNFIAGSSFALYALQ